MIREQPGPAADGGVRKKASILSRAIAAMSHSEPPDRQLCDALRRVAAWPDATISPPLSVRSFSRLYRASCSDGRQAAVKVCLDGERRADAELAARQFDALDRVAAAMRRNGSERFGVPQPVFVDPDIGAYGMSWVDGRPLTVELERATAAAAAGQLREAGRWLWAFHAAGPLHVDSSDSLDSKRRYVETMAGHALPERVFGEALTRLRDTVASTQQGLRKSWLHGDFKPDNLLVTDRRVVGIDLALSYEDAVEHDLAQFLHALDLHAQRSWGAEAATRVAPLRTAFVDGYRQDGGTVSTPLLEWLTLWTTLVIWHSRRVEHPLRGWWSSRGIGPVVQRMLARATDIPTQPPALSAPMC